MLAILPFQYLYVDSLDTWFSAPLISLNRQLFGNCLMNKTQKLSKLWNNFPFHLTVKLRFVPLFFFTLTFLYMSELTRSAIWHKKRGSIVGLKILTIGWHNFWRIILTCLFTLLYFYDTFLKITFILFIGCLKKKTIF